MSSDSIMKALYAQQRAQILHMKTMPENLIDDAYAFAWEAGVYPIQHDGDYSVPDLPHENFSEYFLVNKEKVEEISNHMDELWIDKKSPTFDELEAHFGRESRSIISKISRYYFLMGLFDETFWTTLCKTPHGSSAPVSITREFSISELSL